MESDKIDSNFS